MSTDPALAVPGVPRHSGSGAEPRGARRSSEDRGYPTAPELLPRPLDEGPFPTSATSEGGPQGRSEPRLGTDPEQLGNEPQARGITEAGQTPAAKPQGGLAALSRDARRELWRLQRRAADVLEDTPTRSCRRVRFQPRVQIQATGSGRSHFTGLKTCQSQACPTCSLAWSCGVGAELEAATAAWKREGGAVWLLTLTAPHRREDALEELLDGLRGAWDRFRSRAAFRRARKVLGMEYARAYEVTWSERNGWHPHFHVLLFVRPSDWDPLNLQERQIWTQLELEGEWERACVDAGLRRPDGSRGCDLRGGESAARYPTKWSWDLSAELTAAHRKTARRGSFTPLGLLESNRRALFREFYDATKGRRRKQYTRGLARLIQRLHDSGEIGALEEHEEQETTPEPGVVLAALNPWEWSIVVRRGAYAQVLELAELGGQHAVDDWIWRGGTDAENREDADLQPHCRGPDDGQGTGLG